MRGLDAHALHCGTELACRVLRGTSAFLVSFGQEPPLLLGSVGADDPIDMVERAIDFGRTVARTSEPVIGSLDELTRGEPASWIGVAIGADGPVVLCVADTRPRSFSGDDADALTAIAEDLARRHGERPPAPVQALLQWSRTVLLDPADASTEELREAADNLDGLAKRLRDLAAPNARPCADLYAMARTEACGAARILLADDLDLNRKLIVDMLSLDGHVVECVTNGAAAVHAAAGGRYDLVLMDVIMPEMDGLAATRAIRELPGPASDVPILGLTANAYREHLDICLQAGMDGVVAKPMTIDSLTSAVAHWTRQRHAA